VRPRPAETVLLGLLQGPAELLPVSSSAHVELLPWALGWAHARLPGEVRKEVEVALHLGTAVALLDRRPRRAFAALSVAPAAVAGLALEGPIERRLGGPRSIAAGLIAGSAALVISDRVAAARAAGEAGARDALLIGLAQAGALWPGVSRSAATRSAARALGFTREAAAELSAEAALPVLAGASALKGLRVLRRGAPDAALVAGAAAAAISTRAALRARLLAGAPPAAFAAYRCALAGAVVAAARRRPARPTGLAAARWRPAVPTVLPFRHNRSR
jgi:undecaprenyl-diphosphatase